MPRRGADLGGKAMVAKAFAGVSSALFLLLVQAATAAEPRPWQMGLQEPASPVMARIAGLHGFLTAIVTVIVLFVMGLLGWVIWRYRAGRNPVPSTVTHNSRLEIAWTAIPALILIAIAGPSLDLLYYMDKTKGADMTLKVTGHQWYWSYTYPDRGDVAFDAFMIQPDDLQPGQKRLLETDRRVVLPVQTDIRVLLASDDVIHSWAVPALGIKTDSVPGRLNETWMRIERPGVYYGQCSELCGVLHGFMPIAIEAVPRPQFEAWLAEKRAEAVHRRLAAAD
ncbi:MAG: cytochrome c oxidase subunit II [Magnetospirillum sp. WYHS-4]